MLMLPTFVCRAGSRLCAFAITDVLEVMRPLPIVAVEGAPSFVEGLSIIRGLPTPVVALASLLGARQSAPSRRFVTLKAGQRRLALAVEDVLGVQDLSDVSLRECPALLHHAGEDAISAIGALDRELLFMIQAAKVLPSSVEELLDQRIGLS